MDEEAELAYACDACANQSQATTFSGEALCIDQGIAVGWKRQRSVLHAGCYFEPTVESSIQVVTGARWSGGCSHALLHHKPAAEASHKARHRDEEGLPVPV